MNLFHVFKTFTKFILIVSIACIFSDCESELNAEKIIQKSIKFHGGLINWKNISSISYIKQITLLDSKGNLEQEISQKITHGWNPTFTEMEWKKPEGNYRAFNDHSGIKLFKNNEILKNSVLLKQTKKNLDGALYVFWQPYKLLDKKAKLEYFGEESLLDSISVHKIKVSYIASNDDAIWYYYFDTIDFRLIATRVDHKERKSLILNETVESITGLYLNETRKSYFLDSLEKISYLRAVYTYEIKRLIKN